MPSLVELIANNDDCAFDQACVFGRRVEDHAVYCHNYDCPGFKANPAYNKDKEGKADGSA